jgi:hypothetical protein
LAQVPPDLVLMYSKEHIGLYPLAQLLGLSHNLPVRVEVVFCTTCEKPGQSVQVKILITERVEVRAHPDLSGSGRARLTERFLRNFPDPGATTLS